jgi:hypothetical protein
VDLGIGDVSARQDSMSIARKAHHGETTARQDSMSIAGIVYNGALPADNPLGPNSEAQLSSARERDMPNEPMNDPLRLMGDEKDEATMTDSLMSQGYSIHYERNAKRDARANDASAPMGYANMENSRAIEFIASYPNHFISVVSEGDVSDENDHHQCQHLSKAKSSQLPTMQASKLQVHVQIERNGYLSNSIGKLTPSSAVSSIQTSNFSSIEHSVTRLRGRVRTSYSTKAQCRGSILTRQRPRAHARDLMSMAK